MTGPKDLFKIGVSIALFIIGINLLWTIGFDLSGLISNVSSLIFVTGDMMPMVLQQMMPNIKLMVSAIALKFLMVIILALIVKKLMWSYFSNEM